MRKLFSGSRGWSLLASIAVVGATLAITRSSSASDHQDTPDVELSPRMDVNDVYAFPGASPDRIVLAMTTSSPITPAQSAGAAFDPNLLYQLKIDNSGDGIEDKVIQITFTGSGANQQVIVRGPVAPAQTGIMNTLVTSGTSVTGTTNTNLGSASGLQAFAGIRDDPFFLDLEQFFRIVPDRRPSRGPLSLIGPAPEASAFRPKCTGGVINPGQAQFDQTHGCAADFVRTFNSMAIVIELPEAMIKGAGNNVGVWATVSR